MSKKTGTNQQIALDALRENSAPGTFGDFLRSSAESDGSTSYFFVAKQKGYEGWEWCVSLFETADSVTVSEIVLLPSEDALMAPAWVPWSERLAEWKAMQAELEAQAEEAAAAASEGDDSDEEAEGIEDSDSSSDDSDWVDAADSVDESEDLATQELKILKEVSFAVDDDESDADDAAGRETDSAANLEKSKEAETDSDDAGVKPPRLSRRNRFWGKKKNK